MIFQILIYWIIAFEEWGRQKTWFETQWEDFGFGRQGCKDVWCRSESRLHLQPLIIYIWTLFWLPSAEICRVHLLGMRHNQVLHLKKVPSSKTGNWLRIRWFLTPDFLTLAFCWLSISDALSSDKETQMTGIYDLVAVLTHKGRSADSGHYVAWVKQESG